MTHFKQVESQSTSMNEHNDCAVRAVAHSTGVEYPVVHKMFSNAGRRTRGRTPSYITDNVLNTMVKNGMIKSWSHDVPRSRVKYQRNVLYIHHKGRWETETAYRTGKFTMKTIADQYPKAQPFMAFVRGHVAAVVESKVHDWTKGRNHRVNSVYLINR